MIRALTSPVLPAAGTAPAKPNRDVAGRTATALLAAGCLAATGWAVTPAALSAQRPGRARWQASPPPPRHRAHLQGAPAGASLCSET